MNFQQTARREVPTGLEWLGLALMSLAAPWLAAYIHSACVFVRGIQFYKAEVGGVYFGDRGLIAHPSLESVLVWIGGCGVPAIVTFLLLIASRNWKVSRWVVWAGVVALWTGVCFNMEVAFK